MAKPLVINVLADSTPGQLAPPLLVQLSVVQFKPALGVSFTMALLAQAGPALLAVMVYSVVLPATRVVVALVLLNAKAAGAMMVAVCVAFSTELRVLRRVEVSAAVLVTVPVVLADTVALMVKVSVVAGDRLKAAMGKARGAGQPPTMVPLLVALQLMLPSVPPAEMMSLTVTPVAVMAGLLLLIVSV